MNEGVCGNGQSGSSSESLVPRFWETKKDMDGFYQTTDNKALSESVEKLKAVFEQPLERKD